MAARPVRVLLIVTHAIQYMAPQFRELTSDSRVRVTVAFLSMQGAEAGFDPGFGRTVSWDVPLLDGYHWIHPRNRSPWPSTDKFFGLFNPGLWREIARGRYDVVVCYGYRAASFCIAAAAAKASSTSLIWATDATSLAVKSGSSGWKLPAKRRILPMIFRSGTATITFSSRAAEFVQSLGLPSDRVFMTPYVVDNAFFAARAREVNVREVRRRWSIPVDAVIAAFVGKLVGWKRPSDLILAAAEVPDLWVIVAGEGQERPAMEALAIQVGVADRVRFLGFQNQTDLPAVYAAADVLVLPSEYEAFGLVVNEAFACGTPALVSESCGSASDLIVTGVTGFTFPPGDIARLAEELSLLSGDPSLRTKLAEGARRRISEWDLSAYREAAVKACVCAAAR